MKISTVIFLQYSQLIFSWPLLRHWNMLGNETFGDLSLTIAQIDCQLDRENCSVADESGDYVYGRSIIVALGILPSLEPGIEVLGHIAIL